MSISEEVLMKYRDHLINVLPMHDQTFIASLSAHGLVPHHLEQIFRAADPSSKVKAEFFLNNVITPPLSNKDDSAFIELLNIMGDYDKRYVWLLAQQIRYKLMMVAADADKLKQEMIEAMLKARDTNHSILVRYGKVLFCGAGGTGKSNFLNLLIRDGFQSLHISTDVAKPQQVTMKAQVSDEFEFEKMDIDKEILLLTSYLQEQLRSQPITTLNDDNVQAPSQDDEPTDKKSNPTADSEFALFNLDTKEEKPLKPPGKIWDILTFVDTGGQPQFINMLPVVNSFAMITFIVHDMSKGLHNEVEVMHKDKKGKDSHNPYTEKYNNLELIKTLISYASNIILPDNKFLNDLKDKFDNCSRGKAFSLISLVGTHSDKISEERIAEIDKELVEKLKPSGEAEKVHPHLHENYRYLVPVDNEKQSKADDISNKKFTDPSKIREHIYKQLQKQDHYPVPVHWILLELEIRKKCGYKKFISYKDVLQLSKEKKLGDEDFVKKGLRFHHLFGVLLYFEKVEGMRDLIITDHRWLFEKLTKIVVDSYKSIPDTTRELEYRENSGILTETALDELDIDSDFEMAGINITNKPIDPKKAFLELLKYLQIVAEIYKTYKSPAQLFMPVLLDGYNLSCVQEIYTQSRRFVTTTNETIDSVPLLIQFESGDGTNFFPRGIFCFLVVQLINSTESKWEPYRQAYRNFITLINEDISLYITLIDKIFVLEVLVTPVTKDVKLDAGIHGIMFDMINNSLVDFGKEFNISVELNYGFMCKSKKCSDKKPHISCVKRKKNIVSYCIYKEPTKLEREHDVWLENFYKNTSMKKEDVKAKGGSERVPADTTQTKRKRQKGEESSDTESDNGITKSKATKKTMQSIDLSTALSCASKSVSDAWNLKRLDSICLNNIKLNGTGTLIAILDTTIDRSCFTGKKITDEFSDFANSDILVIDCLPNLRDASTAHGTICSAVAVGLECEIPSGVIPRGVAPGAKLVVYRIANEKSCYNNAVLNALEGIQNAVENGIKFDVVSISYDCDENSEDEIHRKIKELTEKGITFVAAAGNRGNNQACACIPARFDNVISVGALDVYGRKAPYTPPVKSDVYAPGVFPTGDEGTSFATPAVAGLVLLLKQWANSVGSPAKENINRVEILRKIFSEDMYVKSDSTEKYVGTSQPNVKTDDDGKILVFQPVDFFMNMKDTPEKLNEIVQKHLAEKMEY